MEEVYEEVFDPSKEEGIDWEAEAEKEEALRQEQEAKRVEEIKSLAREVMAEEIEAINEREEALLLIIKDFSDELDRFKEALKEELSRQVPSQDDVEVYTQNAVFLAMKNYEGNKGDYDDTPLIESLESIVEAIEVLYDKQPIEIDLNGEEVEKEYPDLVVPTRKGELDG